VHTALIGLRVIASLVALFRKECPLGKAAGGNQVTRETTHAASE